MRVVGFVLLAMFSIKSLTEHTPCKIIQYYAAGMSREYLEHLADMNQVSAKKRARVRYCLGKLV